MSATTIPRSRPGVLADLMPGSAVRDALLVTAGAGLTGVAAQVSVHTPLTPVPFTLQTLAVLLTGAALGTVRGMAAMLLYLVAGAVGVPWYANHAHGIGGPTFGYIVGFVVAAALAGELARRGNDRRALSTIGLMATGNAVIYLVGALWLALSLHLGARQAVMVGVVPFLPADALKIAIAAGVLPLTWRWTRGVSNKRLAP